MLRLISKSAGYRCQHATLGKLTVHDRSTSKNTKCEMRLALTVKRFIPETYVYAAPMLTKSPHPLGGGGGGGSKHVNIVGGHFYIC